MKVRRVVTAHTAAGLSTIVSEDRISGDELPGCGLLWRLWSADKTANYPKEGADPASTEIFPPIGGVRCWALSIPPHTTAVPKSPSSLRSVDAPMHHDSDKPGMHRSDSLDFVIMVSGVVKIEMEDGTSTDLKPGDVIVNNGTIHRWSNPGDEPSLYIGVMIGAQRGNST